MSEAQRTTDPIDPTEESVRGIVMSDLSTEEKIKTLVNYITIDRWRAADTAERSLRCKVAQAIGVRL